MLCRHWHRKSKRSFVLTCDAMKPMSECRLDVAAAAAAAGNGRCLRHEEQERDECAAVAASSRMLARVLNFIPSQKSVSLSLPLARTRLSHHARSRPKFSMPAAIATLLHTPGAEGNMYDVIEKHKLAPPECANGCAAWADVAKVSC